MHGASVVEARKLQRAELREARRRDAFLGNWASQSVIPRCNCRTHKESVATVRTAYRSAGFLTMVTESGFIAGLTEIITTENSSQRYAFLAHMAVHDDACHVRMFAEAWADGNELTARLAHDMRYIIDKPHSRAHVDAWCRGNCFPDLPENVEALGNFPTPFNEAVNAHLSPLAHTVHHMQRWVCNFIVAESVDVHNILKGQRAARGASRRAAKRARCASWTGVSEQNTHHNVDLRSPLAIFSSHHHRLCGRHSQSLSSSVIANLNNHVNLQHHLPSCISRCSHHKCSVRHGDRNHHHSYKLGCAALTMTPSPLCSCIITNMLNKCIATVIVIVAVLSVARSTALSQASPTLPDHRYHAWLLMLRQRAFDIHREDSPDRR